MRYADDFVIGFREESDARWCLAALRERFAKFGLELHPDKTRLIEFGRYAEERRARRGVSPPETFDFLGFTHISGKTRRGDFTIHRKTARKKFQAKLKDLKFARVCKRWLPSPKILHPYPDARFKLRDHPRQEPYAVVPHVRICAGGGPQGPSLPRFSLLTKRPDPFFASKFGIGIGRNHPVLHFAVGHAVFF